MTRPESVSFSSCSSSFSFFFSLFFLSPAPSSVAPAFVCICLHPHFATSFALLVVIARDPEIWDSVFGFPDFLFTGCTSSGSSSGNKSGDQKVFALVFLPFSPFSHSCISDTSKLMSITGPCLPYILSVLFFAPVSPHPALTPVFVLCPFVSDVSDVRSS